MSRSSTSGSLRSQVIHAPRYPIARHQGRAHGQDAADRGERAAAAGGTVRVERFHFTRDTPRVVLRGRTTGDAQPHLVGIAGALAAGAVLHGTVTIRTVECV